MKTIKTYKLFLEDSDSEFDLDITDEPDIKIAKDELSVTKKQLSDYKAKKNLIDTAFLNIKLDADLQKKVDEIIGKADLKTPKNPFLVGYLNVANLKRKLDKLQTGIDNDKIKKDNFSEELKLSKDDITKKSITTKITDITKRISTNMTNIPSLVKDISDAQKSLDDKMKSIEKNMMDNIKKLTDQTSK